MLSGTWGVHAWLTDLSAQVQAPGLKDCPMAGRQPCGAGSVYTTFVSMAFFFFFLSGAVVCSSWKVFCDCSKRSVLWHPRECPMPWRKPSMNWKLETPSLAPQPETRPCTSQSLQPFINSCCCCHQQGQIQGHPISCLSLLGPISSRVQKEQGPCPSPPLGRQEEEQSWLGRALGI